MRGPGTPEFDLFRQRGPARGDGQGGAEMPRAIRRIMVPQPACGAMIAALTRNRLAKVTIGTPRLDSTEDGRACLSLSHV